MKALSKCCLNKGHYFEGLLKRKDLNETEIWAHCCDASARAHLIRTKLPDRSAAC
jgi:hypothetical protein